jgi:hypothetical protein
MPVATAQTRTLYHSRLRDLGRVVAVLTHRPRESKFAGRPPYARFVIDGQEFDYQCETPAIAEQLADTPLNVPLRIHALGSKEGAHLELEQAEAGPTGPTFYPATTSRTAAQNRVQAPAPAPAVPTLSGSYFDCLEVAVVMVEAFRKRHGREPSEAERAIACSLWIEQNRSNGSKPLTRGAQ